MKDDLTEAAHMLVLLSKKAEEMYARSMLTCDRQIVVSQNDLAKIANDLRFVLNCLGEKPNETHT